MTEGKASMNGNLANAAREMNRKEGQEASFCVPPKEDLGLPSNKVVQFELEPLTAQPLEWAWDLGCPKQSKMKKHGTDEVPKSKIYQGFPCEKYFSEYVWNILAEDVPNSFYRRKMTAFKAKNASLMKSYTLICMEF